MAPSVFFLDPDELTPSGEPFDLVHLLDPRLTLRAQNATMGAWYQFENNVADSAATYDAVNNNVTYTSDIAGVGSSAGHFSGLNAYLSLPNGWLGSNQFVGFSIWFKTQGNVCNEDVFQNHSDCDWILE